MEGIMDAGLNESIYNLSQSVSRNSACEVICNVSQSVTLNGAITFNGNTHFSFATHLALHITCMIVSSSFCHLSSGVTNDNEVIPMYSLDFITVISKVLHLQNKGTRYRLM